MFQPRLSLVLVALLQCVLHRVQASAEGHLVSLPLYGNIGLEYGYYFLDAMVGTPPQRVSVVLELSSNILAFPCTECVSCGTHLDPAFRLNSSSSAVPVPCGRPGSACEFQQDFTEGSLLRGFLFHDTVHLVGVDGRTSPASQLQIGCITSETRLFQKQQASGVIGLGRSSLGAARSVTETLFDDKFAICLSARGGEMTVGGFNATFHTSTEQRTVAFNNNNGFITLKLHGLFVSGQRIATCNRAVLLDVGTTLTYFDSATYRLVTQAIEAHCEQSGHCGVNTGPCWKVSSQFDFEPFPDIVFKLEDVLVTWSPSSYLLRHWARKNHACYAFDDDGQRASIVLGASWMVNRDVLFDFKERQVVIADANCPRHHVHRAKPHDGHPPTGGPNIDKERLALKLLVTARRTSKPPDFEEGDGARRHVGHPVDHGNHWQPRYSLALTLGVVLVGGICFGMAMGAVCHAQLLRGEAREPLLGGAGELTGGESLEWELPSLPPLTPRQSSLSPPLRLETDGI
mmetsp:Transcript_41124/g.94603  ORF Transcript_41124/g.94603 Transcript_41124/m.94603 type:complete len:515 (+) Transcript_41124:81-1625(+)